MKTVSDSYKESMRQPLRNPSHVQVVVDSIDRDIARDGYWRTGLSPEASYADVDSMDYTASRGDPPATLELNYWNLDGTFGILPDDARNQGYVSDELSDAEGNCDIVLLRYFDNPHVIKAWTITFDTRAGEWPMYALISLDAVLEHGNGWTSYIPVDKVTLQNLTEAQYERIVQPAATDRVTIQISRTLPYRRVRIESFLFGMSLKFTGADLTGTYQEHDVDPLSRRLPQEGLEFTAIDLGHRFDPENPAGIYEYIYARSPVSISFGYDLLNGTTEWLEPDRYILNAKPIFDNGRVTFQAGGLIASMTGTYYKDTVGTKDLKTMAENVLQDAADQGYIPQDSWEVDESLEDMETTGILPIGTHAECIQMIAHAARCVLYTDGENVIHVAPFVISQEITNDLRLDYGTVYENTQLLSRTDLLKAVSVSEYGYVNGAQAAETLYSASTTDTVMHIEFPVARDVTVEVTGVRVIEEHVYAQAVDLVLEAGTKGVTITGIPLGKTETISTVNVNSEGETDREANELITTDAMRDALSAHVRAYLSLRNTYDVTYRGNPELETRDVVRMQTRYSGIIPVLVLKDTITFTGALRGSVKGKGLM